MMLNPLIKSILSTGMIVLFFSEVSFAKEAPQVQIYSLEKQSTSYHRLATDAFWLGLHSDSAMDEGSYSDGNSGKDSGFCQKQVLGPCNNSHPHWIPTQNQPPLSYGVSPLPSDILMIRVKKSAKSEPIALKVRFSQRSVRLYEPLFTDSGDGLHFQLFIRVPMGIDKISFQSIKASQTIALDLGVVGQDMNMFKELVDRIHPNKTHPWVWRNQWQALLSRLQSLPAKAPVSNPLLVHTAAQFLRRQRDLFVENTDAIDTHTTLNAFDTQVHYVKAVQQQSQEHYWQALFHWNQLRYTFDVELRHRAIQNTISLLNRLDAKPQAQALLQSSYLKPTTDSFQELLFIQLYQQFNEAGLHEKCIQLLSYEFLRRPTPDLLMSLSKHLAQLRVNHLSMVMALLVADDAKRALLVSDILKYRDSSQDSSPDSSQDSSGDIANMQVIMLAQRSWVDDEVNGLFHPQPVDSAVIESIHAKKVTHKRDDFFRITPLFSLAQNNPLTLRVHGPLRLAVNVFPKHSGDHTQWLTVKNQKDHYFQYALRPQSEPGSGSSQRIALTLEKGIHDLSLSASGASLTITLDPSPAPSDSAILSSLIPGVKAIDFDRYYDETTFMNLFFHYFYVYENKSDKNALFILDTLYHKHRSQPFIAKVTPLWQRVKKSLQWQAVYPLQHDGVRVAPDRIDQYDKDTRLQHIFSRNEFFRSVLLTPQNPARLTVAYPTRSWLQVELEQIPYSTQGQFTQLGHQRVSYQVGSEVRHLDLSPDKPIGHLSIALDQGQHTILLGCDNDAEGTLIKATFVHDKSTTAQWIKEPFKSIYHYASYEQPVVVDIRGPTVLQVERITDDARSLDYVYVSKGRHRLKIKSLSQDDKTQIKLLKRVLAPPTSSTPAWVSR